MKQKPLKSYLLTVFLTASIILGFEISFNAIIDPFGINQWVSIKNLNAYKPCIFERGRLFKAYAVRRLKSDSIILGTSRCNLAFRPDHPGWKKEAQRPYNLGLDGAYTKEMYFYLVHAQSINPLKLVLLGLDIYPPGDDEAQTSPDFDSSILMKNNHLLERLRIFLVDLKVLSSFDTFKNSVRTILSQRETHESWISPDGQRLGDIFFNRQDSDFIKFGQRHYFDKFDQLQMTLDMQQDIYEKNYKTTYRERSKEKKDAITSLGYVRKIIDFCRNHNINLKIFYTPSHSHQLELTALTDQWLDMENDKRKLVAILTDDARRHPGKPFIPLFDFSVYSLITTEDLPPLGSKTEMKFYWDSSHFKEKAGDLVLNTIFQTENPKNFAPKDFGILLTENNIESVLAKTREQKILYEKYHPQDIAAIKSWVDDFKRKNRTH